MATLSIKTNDADDADMFLAFPVGGKPGTVDTINKEWAYTVQQAIQRLREARAVAAAIAGVQPVPAPVKPNHFAYAKALDSLGLTPAWDAAIQAAINAASDKQVFFWWTTDLSNTITTQEPEWAAIVVQMNKAGGFGKSSEAELIKLAGDILAGTAAQAAEVAK